MGIWKLAALKLLLSDLAESSDRVEDELGKLRIIKRSADGRSSSNELKRQLRLNDQLFEAIIGHQADIDSAIVEQRRLYQELTQVVEDHRRYNRDWVIGP
jgi:hypothetical protein